MKGKLVPFHLVRCQGVKKALNKNQRAFLTLVSELILPNIHIIRGVLLNDRFWGRSSGPPFISNKALVFPSMAILANFNTLLPRKRPFDPAVKLWRCLLRGLSALKTAQDIFRQLLRQAFSPELPLGLGKNSNFRFLLFSRNYPSEYQVTSWLWWWSLKPLERLEKNKQRF